MTIDKIFSFLEWEDIKNLRLQNRQFADIGLNHFPRTVTLVATKWSFDRVEQLLSLEVVRQNVRSLRICCYMFWPTDSGPTSMLTSEL